MHWGNGEMWLSVERKFVLEPPERQVTTWELQRWPATCSSILSHQLAKGLYIYQEGCAELPRSDQGKSKRIRSREGVSCLVWKVARKSPCSSPRSRLRRWMRKICHLSRGKKKSKRNLRDWKQRPIGRAPGHLRNEEIWPEISCSL